jgi:hypothetical protein
MLKFFYRLKRRHGVVLFAVIAIMTLLIAMATTAYFTARSSYQTVVSNYDFSQTYLSAISISDMLIEAVTQDTSHPGADNNYTDLKKAVQDLRDHKTAGAADAVITGFTVHNGAAATDANILTEAASYPVEAGIFDAARVEIKYVKKEADKDPVTNVETGLTRHYFTFTTTVYYRDTTITVQDTVLNKSGTESKKDASPFSRFFTSTSQTAAGKETGTSRVVVIDCNEISDDAYFENDYTLIGYNEHAGNKIKGSLISSGSVYMYQMNTDMPATAGNNRNDWFIGKDLVMTANSGQNIDLKGSNIYVGGDLIIARSGINFTCANLYVKGNIYYLDGSSGTINANVYCGGSILGTAADPQGRVGQLNSLLSPQGYSSGITYSNGDPSRLNITGAKGVWDDSTLITISSQVVNGNKYEEKLSSGITLGEAFQQKTTKYNYDTYTADTNTLSNELNIDPSVLNMDTSALMSAADLQNPDGPTGGTGVYTTTTTAGDSYSGSTTTTMTLTANADGTVTCEKTVVGEKKTHSWPPPTYTEHVDIQYINTTETFNYTASGSEFTFNYDDGSKMVLNKSTNTARVDGTSAGGATIKKEGDGRIVVDIDYTTNGYLLGLKDTNGGLISYNFGTKSGETMPVVLKANFNDGSSTQADQNGNNAFSWSGNTSGRSDGKKTIVELMPDGSDYGNVTFEVGNYKKVTKDDGTEEYKYVPYSLSGYNSISTPIYYEGENLIVGTKKQADYLKGRDLGNAPGLDGMMGTLPYAKDEYQNHIMLISNRNDGTAFDGTVKGHVICGYLYAPNGVYKANPSSQSHPVFGGMIVSIYDCKESWFQYVSPDPEIISSLLDKMKREEYPGEDTPTAGVWQLQEGKNYLG